MLCFYTGDFETVGRASINPQGSLGWRTSFIQYDMDFEQFYYTYMKVSK